MHHLKTFTQIIFVLLFHIWNYPFLKFLFRDIPIVVGIAVIHCLYHFFSGDFFRWSIQGLSMEFFVHFKNTSEEVPGLLGVQVLSGFVVNILVPDLVYDMLNYKFVFKCVLELFQQLPRFSSSLVRKGYKRS